MFSGPAIGLYSSPNPFSQTPAGTLKVADNVRFTAPGVLEPRRGFDYLVNGEFGSAGSLADALAFYAGTILLAYDLTSVALYTPGSGFEDFDGTFEPVGSNRMRFEGAARSVFFNPSSGVKVWDGVGFDDQPQTAGNPLPLTALGQPDTADGWLESDSAVAYRYTICSKDAFGRVVEGPTSGRTVVRNLVTAFAGSAELSANVVTVFYNYVTDEFNPYVFHVGDVVVMSPTDGASFPAGAKTITAVNNSGPNPYFQYAQVAANAFNSVDLDFAISVSVALTMPLALLVLQSLVGTNNFLRVYRSPTAIGAGASPSDEMRQCYESPYLTAADLAAGEFSFIDSAPENIVAGGPGLYTNENGGAGALQGNFQPPQALDLVYWANRMWYANTSDKESLTFALIGVGAPDGLQVNDTFTISNDDLGDLTLTAGTDFDVFQDEDPGLNIERTAAALIEAINDAVGNEFIAAYSASSEFGLPGLIRIQNLIFETTSPISNSLYSSRATCWTPQLPTLVSPQWPAPVSDANRHPAALYWSRLDLPEAVPPLNNAIINSDADSILRIFPLHYRLLIFKTDGIYTCTNVEPFSIQKLSAFVLLAPDSLQALEDRVYALTDQGIVTISDAGVVEISDPIDDVFNALNAPASIDDLRERTFGLAYRSERQAFVWTIEKNDDGTFSDDNAQAFALSTLSEGFTRYPFGVRCGGIDPDSNSMVFAPTDNNYLYAENKSLTDADYYDLRHVIGAPLSVSASQTELTFLPVVAAVMSVGDVLRGNGAGYVITAVDGVTVTVDAPTGWTTGTSLTHYESFPCAVEFNKLTAGTPAELKLMEQATLLFRENGVRDVTASFTTETTTAPVDVLLEAEGWGDTAWGDLPWGSPTQQLRRIEPIPESIAQCAQLSVGFRTRQALKKFEFLGLDVRAKKDAAVNRG